MQNLNFGTRGQDVTNLQEALNYQLPLVIPGLVVDGIFGSKTQARVKQYQSIRGLVPDGIVGPKTNKTLYCFIDHKLHMIVPSSTSAARRLEVGDSDVPRTDPVLPPVPQLILPFPEPFKPPPPPVFIPLPKLTLGGSSTEFELSAGVQRAFARSLTGNSRDNVTSVFSNVAFSFWKRPLGKFVEVAFGPGAWLERDVNGDANTKTRVGIWAKGEVKNLLTIGPLDLFKLIVEHKTATTVTGPIELNSDIEVGINPTIEVHVVGHKVEFGPKFSKFLEIGIGRHGFEVKSGTTVTSGSVTLFF